jgi:hypothetical protein
LSTGGISGAWDVDHDEDDVVDVNVVRASGVDRDLKNQLRSCAERYVVVEEDPWRHQRLVRCKQIEGVPIVVEKDGISQIAYRFGENAPHVTTTNATRNKLNVKHTEETTNVSTGPQHITMTNQQIILAPKYTPLKPPNSSPRYR